MKKNGEYDKIGTERKVDVLGLVARHWMFSVPVDKYPDCWVSNKVNDGLAQFVSGLEKCSLVECGSGTHNSQPIIAFTVKIDKDVNTEETVNKIEEYITENVVPLV